MIIEEYELEIKNEDEFGRHLNVDRSSKVLSRNIIREKQFEEKRQRIEIDEMKR